LKNKQEVAGMSRKWKRMVSKNAKAVSEYKKKQGITPGLAIDKPQMYKGRSIMLPLLFIGISLFLMFSFTSTGQDNMYWFTTISYFLFGLFIYFVRRPYLKVSKSSLSKRGFAREFIVEADHIKQIVCKPGNIYIELSGKQQRWVYSKTLNGFNIEAISQKLKSFAADNRITYVDETQKVS
jgi:hypothetical protein